MIGFNALLRDAGIDLATVKLVRHQDARASRGRTPYDFWLADDGRLDLYQRIQSKDRFNGAAYIASFVGTPSGDTLFTGLYSVDGKGIAPAGLLDPVTGEDVGGLHLYEMTKAEALSEYVGRLVIDWGPGMRSWVQNAANQDKRILEIRRQVGEPPFPGFMAFQTEIGALATTPRSWQTALSAVSGVYLLVCLRTGQQYVGSAYGSGGFWARWGEYAATGHGGNEGLKMDPHTEYLVSILEVAPSSATIDDIIALEGRWKDKLLSRRFGLNRN